MPSSSTCAIPEATIELFSINDANGKRYLLPSPELYLKPMLGHGINRFFHIGPAFRKNEKGSHHAPEFTILEWYRANEDYTMLIEDCINILSVVTSVFKRASEIHNPIFLEKTKGGITYEILSIEKAFLKYVGWNPLEIEDEYQFYEDIVLKVEPALKKFKPTFLIDFPSWAASLSKIKQEDKRCCERFELYWFGMELANGFSELLDPHEQLLRFEKENQKRIESGLKPVEIPDEFLSSLSGCASAAGIALGVDRLLMVLTDSKSIKEVIPAF